MTLTSRKRHVFSIKRTFAVCFGTLLLGGAILSGCTTVDTTRPPAPIVNRQPVPQPTDRPNPTGNTEPKSPEKSVETKDPKTPEVTPKDTTTRPTGPYFNNRDGLTPPHMAGRDTKRLALLLPFSANSERLRNEASSMFQAAELAVFERDTPDVLLIALDTKGTAEGARSATRAALQSGADIILGPIIADNVKAASREAARSKTPVLAFSNDTTVAGNGTYLLSFPPEAEVARVVEYAVQSGVQRFAYLGPDNAYGRRVRAAYEAAVRQGGGQITASETYVGNDISVMQAPAQKLAAFHAEGEAAARRSAIPVPMSFEAILLPEGGNALRSLAPLLPFYDVDPADVQFMGTGRWNDEDTVREPALNRGIFAGADRDAVRLFRDEFDRAYGADPSALASLAYDAVNVGAYIADGDPRTRRARAEDPSGFYGVDGLVLFGPDGQPRRGLAVYQIRSGQFTVVDPAARSTQTGS